MQSALLRIGQLVGLAGVLLMLAAIAMRLLGKFAVGGYQTGTLLLAGIGAVVVGCFLLLWTVAERAQH
jgi:hypothetical protein